MKRGRNKERMRCWRKRNNKIKRREEGKAGEGMKEGRMRKNILRMLGAKEEEVGRVEEKEKEMENKEEEER